MICSSARRFKSGASMSFIQNTDNDRDPEQFVFHPQIGLEYNVGKHVATQIGGQWGVRPQYCDYSCGACGNQTTGRVLCDVKRSDGTAVFWCLCSCERSEPTIAMEKDGTTIMQLPQPKKFHADPAWPKELQDLYEEAAKSFAAGAYTSSSMICRKLLMSCVCHEQDKAKVPIEEGKSFAYYVDYLANNVLTFPAAKAPIDAIRNIGNEANHHVQFVNLQDAERSMTIVHRMLDAIYALPVA